MKPVICGVLASTLLYFCLGASLTGDEGGEIEPNVSAESPRLGKRVAQLAIENGGMSFRAIRFEGRRIFSTPFNKLDGYGDGPMDPVDPTTPGGRPTLQGNGAFLRVNGLDGQSCLECHSVVSHATIPATFGIGGVGGSVSNAMAQPRRIDVTDEAGRGIATFDGRFINPPFLFGSGGVQLLAKEMTRDLQRLRQQAQSNPGADVNLVTKGVSFGVLRYDEDGFDTSRVEGIDDDLVVRPFGRKGEFTSVRAFANEAMQFHFGIQPVEVVGRDLDADDDGVVNEILVGELSALEIFGTSLERPVRKPLKRRGRRGARLFEEIGCASCHIPQLETESRFLSYSFPEEPLNPEANVYYQVDLSRKPAKFRRKRRGGVVVPLFADLKRHDMGPEMAESFGSALDSQFTTARLWGVADTAPYMHDGRALTLAEAIRMHGGEGMESREAFAALSDGERGDIIAFLRTLRTPKNPSRDLDK